MKTPILRIIFLALLLTALAAVAMTLSPSRAAADCVPDPFLVCPAVYAPVLCDDGNIYGNFCEATRVCATGCELIWGPIELNRP